MGVGVRVPPSAPPFIFNLESTKEQANCFACGGREGHSVARVSRSEGERREAGLREIAVRQFTCRRDPPAIFRHHLLASGLPKKRALPSP